MKAATIAETDSAEPARLFSDLAQRWRRETAAHSVLQKKVLHPAYQRIIGLGPAVVPHILRQLQREPAHWFWALNAITGADPAPAGSTFQEAADAWLKWGHERCCLQISATQIEAALPELKAARYRITSPA